MKVFSNEQCIAELEKIVSDKFRGLSARELSIKQLEELLELRRVFAKLEQKLTAKNIK